MYCKASVNLDELLEQATSPVNSNHYTPVECKQRMLELLQILTHRFMVDWAVTAQSHANVLTAIKSLRDVVEKA